VATAAHNLFDCYGLAISLALHKRFSSLLRFFGAVKTGNDEIESLTHPENSASLQRYSRCSFTKVDTIFGEVGSAASC
jgi:hypothetical protein